MNDRITRVTKLVVVESIPTGERQTGTELARDVEDHLRFNARPLPVRPFKLETAAQLPDLLRELTYEVTCKGERPVLHFECHGGEAEGLEFADHSCVSWPELCTFLYPLNQAMRLNLFVGVAACYGDSWIQHIPINRPAPCIALVGPSSEVLGQEIYEGFFNFYLDLFYRTDAKQAIDNLTARKLRSGEFGHLPAQLWFRELLQNYLREFATPDKLDERALAQHKLSLSDGNPIPVEVLREKFIVNLPRICVQYFNTFFMTSTVSDAFERYGAVFTSMSETLKSQGYGAV